MIEAGLLSKGIEYKKAPFTGLGTLRQAQGKNCRANKCIKVQECDATAASCLFRCRVTKKLLRTQDLVIIST
ncbi:MAG: hypothetical protein JWQ40_583 [Segetibacter sp.]|jgi:hypothetical protein|nr:hypothetical protein [Segetibacter sp.]